MIPTFENFIVENSIQDTIWKGLDKLALYIHRNPDIKDAITKSMSEMGDDTLRSFIDGIKAEESSTVIENFEEFNTPSDDQKSSLRKLFSFIEKDHEVRVAIEAAIEQAGKDVIHAFLYDLSDDSDIKDYNNTKNRTRAIIGKNKKREAEKEASEIKIQMLKKQQEKSGNVKAQMIKKIGEENYKVLSKKLKLSEMEIVLNIISTNSKQITKLPSSKIEIIKSLSKADIQEEDILNVVKIIKNNTF